MPRKPTPVPVSKETPVNALVIQDDIAATNQLALITAQHASAVRALAATLKYEGSLSPDALENGARDAIRRINLGVFELGGYLLLLREACPHGEFLPALERLELDPRVVQQYMQVTKRYANSNSHLKALGKTKLLEMLILDNEQLEELELTGQTGELALDDVATMSVKELRAKLREAKLEKDATEKLLATKDANFNKLLRKIQKSTPDEVLLDIQKEATALMNDALGCVRGQIRQAFWAIKNHTTDDHSIFMAGLLGQLQADVSALREEFNLPDVSTAADQALAAEVAQWGPAPTKS